MVSYCQIWMIKKDKTGKHQAIKVHRGEPASNMDDIMTRAVFNAGGGERPRKQYLDAAKLLAVLCVVYGHADKIPSSAVSAVILTCHMPAFFIIYGIAVQEKTVHGKQWSSFLKKKAQALLVPYVLWALIYCEKINVAFVKGVLFGTNASLGRANTNVVLWFLPCMFFATILYQIYSNLFCRAGQSRRRECVAVGTVLLCVIIAYHCRSCATGEKVFGWDIAFLGCAFMICGSRGRYILEWLFARSKKLQLLLFAAGLGVTYFIAGCNGKFCMAERDTPVPTMAWGFYGRIELFFIGAVLGTAAILILSKLLEKNVLLQWMGRFSLVIMAIHYMLFNFVISRLEDNFVGRVIEPSKWLFLRPCIVTFVVFLLCIPTAFIINWACPELNGKKITNYPWKSAGPKSTCLQLTGGIVTVMVILLAMSVMECVLGTI